MPPESLMRREEWKKGVLKGVLKVELKGVLKVVLKVNCLKVWK